MEKVFDRRTKLAPTLVIVCYQCGGLLLAQAEQKTRTCPYCGHTVIVQKAKKQASAKSAAEASQILRRLKSAEATNRQSV